MTDQRRQLAVRGVIFAVLVLLLFFFSRYIPRPFTALAPYGDDFDDFEGIYSSSDKLSKFLQHLGPYSPAVFVLLQVLQVIAAPFPGELTGVAGGFSYNPIAGQLMAELLVDGKPSLDLTTFSPQRFAPPETEAYLAQTLRQNQAVRRRH